MSNVKISIRFFDDREVQAIWDEQNARWWFSVLDIVAVLTDQDDYTKTPAEWNLKLRNLKAENCKFSNVPSGIANSAQRGKQRQTPK